MTSKVDTPDEIMKAVELRSLWVSFKQDHFEESRHKTLRLFLFNFLEFICSQPSENIEWTFGDTREIVHSLTWQFLDQIGELTFSKKIQIPVQDRLYGFLGNYEDQGIYMVWLLHVLTSYPQNVHSILKLSSALVVIVEKLLTLSSHKNASSDIPSDKPSWLHNFFSLDFSKMRDHFPIKNLPNSLEFLVEDAEANLNSISLDFEKNTKFVSICCRMLGILEHLAVLPGTLDHLVRKNQIQSLVQLLQPRTTQERDDFIPVYQQLIRTLSKLIESSTTHLKMILQLRQLNVITYLIHILERKCHSTTTTVEICQLIVFAIRRSSYLSLKLFQEFKEAGGYSVFKNTLVWIGEEGTAYHQFELLATLSHLMFIRETEKDPMDDVEEIKNKEGYSIFKKAFQESSSSNFQYHILRTMFTFMKLNRSGYEIIGSFVPPFDHLFLQFDGLHIRNKKFILEIFEDVLEDSTISLQELTTYCFLLQRTRPSTLIMVMEQLTKLLSNQKMSREQLEEAGIINSFLDLAVNPVQLQTIHAMADEEELQLCLKLINTIEAEQKIELAKMPFAEFVNFEPSVELATAISIVGSKEDVLRVLYAISSLSLELMLVFLSSSRRNQQRFCETGVLVKLYPLTYIDSLRHAVLRIIAVIAVGDQKGIHISVIQELITILQNCAPSFSTDSRIIRMRMDILSTLACIFQSNERTKNAFRDCSGISWGIVVINAIGRRVEEEGDSIVTPEVLTYLKAFLNIFTTLLHNNVDNQQYFREGIQFDLFRETLQKWKFIEGPEAISLCDDLLDMALAGSWPPSCSEHPLQFQNQLFQYSYGNVNINEIPKLNSLKRAKELVSTYACTKCESCLLVTLPEVIKVLVELVGRALPNMDEGVVRLIIEKLKFIIKAIPENQNRLCSVGITQVLFDFFHTVLLSDSKLHRLLQNLIQILASFHISVAELWKFFQLFSPDGFPTPLLRTLNLICEKQTIAPCHYVQFPSYDAIIDIPLSNRTWPPTNGYTISMWIEHEDVPKFRILSLISEQSNNTIVILEIIDNFITLSFKDSKKLSNNNNNSSSSSSNNNSNNNSNNSSSNNINNNQSYSFTMNKELTEILPYKWYHITVCHTPYSIQDGKKENVGNAKLYINGRKVGSLSIPYPKSSGNGKVYGLFGTRDDELIKNSNGTKYSRIESCCWNIGPVYCIEETSTDIDCFLLYQLGPDYIGNLDLDLRYFYNPFTTAIPEFIRFIEKSKLNFNILTEPWGFQLAHLQERIIFAFSPRTMVFAQSVKAPTVNVGIPSSIALIPSLSLSENTITINRAYLRDTLSNIGGISNIIFLIAMLGDTNQRQIALKILLQIIEYSSCNLQEMETICGYELIARIMRKNQWKINEKMLSILFSYVGFQRDPQKMTFSVGVLSNMSAFQYLIMDWRIWKNSELSVQKQLFESLSTIVDSKHEFSSFNIKRFREANVTMQLLWLLVKEESTISTSHAQNIINILYQLMDSPPSYNDFSAILRYLILTHTSSSTIANNNNNNLKSSNYANIQTKSVREHILNFLLKIITKKDIKENTLEQFRKLFKQDYLLNFLDHPSSETRSLIIKIFIIFLDTKDTKIRFLKSESHQTMAEILGSYKPTEDIFSSLFYLLIGKLDDDNNEEINNTSNSNIPKPIKKRNRSYSTSTLRIKFSSRVQDVNNVKHPEILSTIIITASSILCQSNLSYLVIKTLHDMFIQNDNLKISFINNHLVRLLCESFTGEVKRRSLDLDSIEISTKVEEQLLSFLKALTVHSCTHGRLRIVDSVLRYLDMMYELPANYIRSLQNRVVSDVLTFFYENKFYAKPKFTQTYVNLCSLACNIHRFEIIETVPRVKLILEKDKDIPNSYYQLFDVNPFPVSKNTWNALYTTCLNTEMEFYKSLFTVLSQPLKNHPFDVLQSNTDLYVSVSYLVLKITKKSLPTKFQNDEGIIIDDNDDDDDNNIDNETISNNEINNNSKISIECLDTKPIPAGNLSTDENEFLNNNNSLSKNNNFPISFGSGVESDSDIIIEQLDLSDEQPTILKYEDEEFADEDTPLGIWQRNEKRKEDDLMFILDLLCKKRLLDIYCNDVNFIVSLLMYTINLFYHHSSNIRALTFHLWSQITSKCKSISVIKAIFNDSLYSYLQTKNPNELRDKAIHIDNLVDSVLLAESFFQANTKYKKENEETKKPHYEKMANLLIPTLRNTIIRKENYNIISSSINKQFKEEEKISSEYTQRKIDRDRTVQHQWKSLVKRTTHERAIWKIPIKTYKLDATEGPYRIRKRLKPSTDNPLLYYLTPYQFIKGKSWKKMIEENEDKSPISPQQMRERRKQQLDQILQQEKDVELKNEFLYFDLSNIEESIIKREAALLSPFHRREGELIICEKHVYFIDSNAFSKTKTNFEALLSHTRHRHKIKWPYHDIKELHKRRYHLKNNALEIFLITGKTSLLSFSTTKDRDLIYDKILSFDLPNYVDYEKEIAGTFIRMSITEKWQKGYISNLEYLMHLNTIAGRSFNDLTQYPVFPFVQSDYESENIDLNDENRFRDLSKPMGALNEDRLKRFETRYQTLVETGEKPFLYGTHYSNVGAVLHFLIRLAPFSYYFIEFQGGSFDVPDRSFHSMLQTWKLSSYISPADVKEMIPSFYVLPEFLTNINHYDMGEMQKGTKIDDIELPPWSKGNPRLFIRIQRKALESKIVSESLHRWIDLIFGYQQTGEAAIQAKNLFHPNTYEGNVNIDEIEDELDRAAAMAMIDNYGQTPKQIFKKPHPKRTHPQIQSCVFNCYDRLQPNLVGNYGFSVGYILHRPNENSQLVFPTKRIPVHPDVTKYISWGHWDQNLRICSLDSGKLIAVMETMHNDDVTCASMPRNGRLLATGGSAGVVKVWKKLNDKRKNKQIRMKLHSVLHGHSDSITCLSVSQEWSIIVSGSLDNTAIIWDLNRCCFIYSLNQLSGKVLCVAISPTTGDIVTVSDKNDARCRLALWSINGKLLYEVDCPKKINCVRFTSGMEGLYDNVIFGGGDDGCLYCWSAWDLTFLTKLRGHSTGITAITINAENTQVTSGDSSGVVLAWNSKKIN